MKDPFRAACARSAKSVWLTSVITLDPMTLEILQARPFQGPAGSDARRCQPQEWRLLCIRGRECRGRSELGTRGGSQHRHDAGPSFSGVAVTGGFMYWLSGPRLNAWSLP